MSDESVDIKINLTGVTSDVEKKFKDIGDKAKLGIDVPINSKPQPFNPLPKPVQSARHNYSTNDLRDSVYSAKNKGASAASMIQDDLHEGVRGGFYNALNQKIEAIKGHGKNNATVTNNPKFENFDKNKNLKNEENNGENFKNAIFNIQNADFKKIGISKGVGSSGFHTQGGEKTETFQGGEEGGRGSILSKIGSTIPIIGGVLAAATAGIMKLVSDVGEKHVQAMMSQSGTLGATGGYVGGGGGLFANADVAQANIARGRVTGESVFGKGNQINDKEMEFAASQGRGLSEVVETMARLRKENPMGLNYYRGAANQAGFKNLRQTEFISKIAEMSSSLRQQGFSGNMESMMSSIVGMRLGENSDPMRKITIAENIGDKSRLNIFGGGVTGALAMSEALKASGGDFAKAQMLLEGKDGYKFGMNAIKNLDEFTRGFIFKREGFGTFTEGFKGSFGQGQVQEDTSEIQAGFNKPLSFQNQINETFAGKSGADAARIGFEMTQQMLDMYKTLSPTISNLSDTIHNLEKSTLSGLNESLKVIAPTLGKLSSGDFSGVIDDLASKIGQSIKEAMF